MPVAADLVLRSYQITDRACLLVASKLAAKFKYHGARVWNRAITNAEMIRGCALLYRFSAFLPHSQLDSREMRFFTCGVPGAQVSWCDCYCGVS